MKEAIGIFDDVFSPSECKTIIARLEKAVEDGEAYVGKSAAGDNTIIKKSIDFNLFNSDDNEFLSNLVREKFNNILTNEYLENFPHIEDYNHHRIVNGKTYYPLLQIQKYDKDSGHYNTWHVEQEDLNSSNRVFVFILYLNDVEEGGETAFLIKEDGEYIKIQPKEGRLVIHPASWPFIHKGCKPKSSDKYILTTLLCWNH